jgi:hypothetical protein
LIYIIFIFNCYSLKILKSGRIFNIYQNQMDDK